MDAKKLLKLFSVAALGFAGLHYALENCLDKVTPSRGLTEGEVQLLKPVFRDSIDYNVVRIHSSPTADWILERVVDGGSLARTHGNLIVASSNLYASDFSDTYADKHAFVHEVSHIWQSQNCQGINVFEVIGKGWAISLGVDKEYSYSLKDKADLLDYDREQQAEIISDAADIGIFNVDGIRSRMPNPALNRFLDNPKYPRLNCSFF